MRLRTAFLSLSVAAGLAFTPMIAAAQTTLVMVEEQGCVWCARWNEQIAPIYPKTQAGKAAPRRARNRAEHRFPPICTLPAACITRRRSC